MKTKLFCLTLFLIITSSMHAQEKNKKVIEARLNEATMFFQGSELIHSATVSLPKGESEIRIEGISPIIDKNSLKIKATKGVVISSFEFSTDYLSSNKKNPVVKKLQDSIDICNTKLLQIDNEIKINSELKTLLQKGTDKNVAGSEKGLGIDELMKTMEYYKTKSTELENLQTENNKKRTELVQTLNRLNQQLSQETIKNNKTSGILKLVLTSPAITASDLTISYFTASAAWVPYYDINIESTDKPIKIVGKAKIRQTTGLDWEKVKLTLSSATPSNGKIAPLFTTWFLENIYPQYRPRSSSSMQNSYAYGDGVSAKQILEERNVIKNNIDASSTQYMLNGELVDETYVSSLDPNMIKDTQVLDNGTVNITTKSSMDDYISVSDNQMNMVYNIDLPFSVPGNGKEQSLDLQTREAQAEYKYYSVPKLDTETYLLAEISNWQNLNLLSGKANITYDGTYIGETFINAASTHTKLSLTLGTDKRVAVKREKLQDYSSTKFLGNDVRQIFTYKLTVKNNQTKAISMVLKDQYPRSTQKNIEVELLKETSAWTANKEETGVVSWEETIQPGETKTYQLSYSVKYPKGSTLNL